MEYDEFIAAVRDRIGTPGPEEAEVVVTEVLHALAYALPDAERRVLAAALPARIGERLVSGRAEYDPLIDEHLFIGYLMTDHQTTGYWDKTAGGDDVLASTAGEEVERHGHGHEHQQRRDEYLRERREDVAVEQPHGIIAAAPCA